MRSLSCPISPMGKRGRVCNNHFFDRHQTSQELHSALMIPSLAQNQKALSLTEVLEGSPYQSYVYAYPHKTAYRPFSKPVPLTDLWSNEPQQALSLYFHVPFCEFRCGFCNLFTQAQPSSDLPIRYLSTLRTEATIVRESLPEARFSRIAIGGGTPTFLNDKELLELLAILTNVLGAKPTNVPFSCEASPATVTRSKLELLKAMGVDRLSLGIQAFEETTSHAMGRPQNRAETENALALIQDVGFPVLNLDLIYGGESQSLADWQQTVWDALAWQPEELYLYPLYVRPLTGLGRRDRVWDDQRLDAYRAARDILTDGGYEQISMRMFRARSAPALEGPVYCCQEDGMIGLGCGARSYTATVHYSTEYAVGRAGVASILSAYLKRGAREFGSAFYGDPLPLDDRRRRYLLLSLLQCEGLSRPDYQRRFAGDVVEHFPECGQLVSAGLADVMTDRVVLTERGIELSDAIGPWFYSERVRNLMADYQLQ